MVPLIYYCRIIEENRLQSPSVKRCTMHRYVGYIADCRQREAVTLLGHTDSRGNTIINHGGTAIGSGSCSDATGIAIGAGAIV